MGAIISFPQTRRVVRDRLAKDQEAAATVLILPVVRIERASGATPGTRPETPKSPSGRKRGRPASQ